MPMPPYIRKAYNRPNTAFDLGCRAFILKKKKKMEKIAVWPINFCIYR